MENGPFEWMYLLLNMGIFQPAMLDMLAYQRVDVWEPFEPHLMAGKGLTAMGFLLLHLMGWTGVVYIYLDGWLLLMVIYSIYTILPCTDLIEIVFKQRFLGGIL